MENIRVEIVKEGFPPQQKTDLVVFEGVSLDQIKDRDMGDFINKARAYAKIYQKYLVPGLYVREDYLCLCLIDPSGEIIGEQQATHLNQAFFHTLHRSDQLHYFDLPWGKLFLCVDVDIYMPEVLRIAALSGVQTVVSCQYIEDDRYSEEMILAGAWQQAQQNSLYIIHTSNGGSQVISPCLVTEDLTGYLIRGEIGSSVYAECSFTKMSEAYHGFPIFKSLNLPFYQTHMKELCK